MTEIACSLTDEDFRRRREMVRETLRPLVVAREPLDDGLRLTFSDDAASRAQVETFVALERRCCGFLTFTTEADDDGLRLTITGPPEARRMLEAFAGWTAS